MPKENDRAGERQGCEIGGAPLIPCDESSIVLEPGKEPLDFPAARVSTQGAPILGEMDPIGAMRGGESASSGWLGRHLHPAARVPRSMSPRRRELMAADIDDA
jgi:hypothetical protein